MTRSDAENGNIAQSGATYEDRSSSDNDLPIYSVETLEIGTCQAVVADMQHKKKAQVGFTIRLGPKFPRPMNVTPLFLHND